MAQMIIITNEIVKPSPSPSPLISSKTHKLSFHDQNAPSQYIPIIFFYKNGAEYSKPEEISRRLKQSLSKTLAIYYPLSGKIIGNSHVDCNDSGVKFVEAQVHARLQQLIENPNLEELGQFLPVHSLSHDDGAILSVKASFFACGGFCVGICLSHKIADAASATAFMNAWGATCREEEEVMIPPPSFDISLHFPPSPRASDDFSGSKPEVLFTKEKRILKRLVFGRDELMKLRREASSEEVKDPSRVEAVSAFIWRSFIKAKKPKATSFAFGHAVNLRPRTVPPMPDHAFGNCITLASAMISSSEVDEKLSTTGPLASRLRAAIRGVSININVDGSNRDLIHNNNNNNNNNNQEVLVLKSENTCVFSSWLGFPVYEVDFGWGKPVWVGTATIQYMMNAGLLCDTSTGDGVEAWISTTDNDFSRFLQADYNNLLTN